MVGKVGFAPAIAIVLLAGCGPSSHAWRSDDDARADAACLTMPLAIYLHDRDGNEYFYPLGFSVSLTMVPDPLGGAVSTGSGNYKATLPDGKIRVRRVLWGFFVAQQLDGDQLMGLNVYGEQLAFAHAEAPWGVGFVLGGGWLGWHVPPEGVSNEIFLYVGGVLERQTGDRGTVFRVELSAMIGVEGSIALYPSVGFLWLFRDL